MPLPVMEDGGWLIRDSAERFADYTDLAARALGDRVACWTTLDEPVLHTALGYAVGIDAPGLTLLGGAFQAAHHQLLAHGRAVQVLRSRDRRPSQAFSITTPLRCRRPARALMPPPPGSTTPTTTTSSRPRCWPGAIRPPSCACPGPTRTSCWTAISS